MMLPCRTTRRAFTLIELLVVIAIIALLVSILMPALSKAKELARQSSCGMQMRNMMLATLLYTEEYDGRWPGWRGATGTEPFTGLKNENRISPEMMLCPSGIEKLAPPYSVKPIRSYSFNYFIHTNPNYVTAYLPGAYPFTTADKARMEYVSAVRKPSETLLYVESDENSNVGNEQFKVYNNVWQNMISGRHRGANMGFVDFHVEFWRWQWKSTGIFTVHWAPDPGNPDLDRINRAQCPPYVPYW